MLYIASRPFSASKFTTLWRDVNVQTLLLLFSQKTDQLCAYLPLI